MDPLRSKVIRLAYENPQLRKDLLPLLKESSGDKEAKVTLGLGGKELAAAVWGQEFKKLSDALDDGPNFDDPKVYDVLIKQVKEIESKVKGSTIKGRESDLDTIVGSVDKMLSFLTKAQKDPDYDRVWKDIDSLQEWATKMSD